jgi:hypothetical protein
MKHKCDCKYYLMNAEGVRVCSVCGKPAPIKADKPIEDKAVGKPEDK